MNLNTIISGEFCVYYDLLYRFLWPIFVCLKFICRNFCLKKFVEK